MDGPMALRLSVALFFLFVSGGCSFAVPVPAASEIFLTMSYPAETPPDQVQMQLLEEGGQVLSSFNVPQMPRLFSDTGEESVKLKMSNDWVGQSLRFTANAMRNGELSLVGDVTFDLGRGGVQDVLLELLPPGGDARLDGGPIDDDADAGSLAASDAGVGPTIDVDGGASVPPTNDSGVVGSDAGAGAPGNTDGGVASPGADAGVLNPDSGDGGATAPGSKTVAR